MLKVENLTHSFADKLLYKNVSFELFKGEHMGLVGENGCGKSTLFNILLENIIPDSGNIEWLKNIKIGYLDQYAKLNENLTVFEYLKTAFEKIFAANDELNLLYDKLSSEHDNKIINRIAKLQEFLDRNGYYQIESEILKVADNLGITAIGIDKPLKNLSGGQQTKIILAKLLLEKPDILLLDEPTNFLDKEHIKWLAQYLNSYENAFIIISHDFDFLNQVTNCICEIEFCSLKKYKGNFAHFLEQKEFKKEGYIKAYGQQQKQIKKLEDYIAKNKARASTANMAKSRQKQLDKIERLTKPQTLDKPTFKFKSLPITSQKALVIKNLEIGYNYALLPKINIEIESGQKTVITGFNGIGKSTLLKTLVNEIRPLSGNFEFAKNTKLGYFKQDLKFENPNLSAIEIIASKFPDLSQKEIRKYLAQCALKSKNVLQPIYSLSGGEQSKIKLCILTLTKTNFLILDEPTNHLDENSKSVLKSQLENWPANLILVSHEENFYKDWADKIICVNP